MPTANVIGTSGKEEKLRVPNNHYEDLSIDIETAAQPANGPNEDKLVLILSVAAVFFNPNEMTPFEDLCDLEISDRTFYAPVSLANSLSRGFDVDKNTLEFWRRTTIKDNRVNALADAAHCTEDLVETFARLNHFLTNEGKAPRRIWAKSPTFDCSILRDAFNKVGMKLNINVFDERDIRNVMDEMQSHPMPTEMIVHNPTHDAALEAMTVQEYNRQKREMKERLAKLDFFELQYADGAFPSHGRPIVLDSDRNWCFKEKVSVMPTQKPRGRGRK